MDYLSWLLNSSSRGVERGWEKVGEGVALGGRGGGSHSPIGWVHGRAVRFDQACPDRRSGSSVFLKAQVIQGLCVWFARVSGFSSLGALLPYPVTLRVCMMTLPEEAMVLLGHMRNRPLGACW